MKKIKITEELNNNVKFFSENLFESRRKKGKKSFKMPLDNLKDLHLISTESYQKDYLTKIIDEYSTLLYLKPSKFNIKIKEFEKIKKIQSNKESETFKFSNKIVEALRYDAYRDVEYPKFIKTLKWNNKVCFYCNYAGTLNISQNNNKILTYYDLDHILPKSKYPFLATSFYNFIPSCANCNRKKSNNVIPNLNPFYEEDEDSNLEKIFTLDKKTYAQYLLDNKVENLNIKVSDTINSINIIDYKKIVDIESLYNSQKNVVEEIIWKNRIYTNQIIKDIMGINKIDLNKKDINRIIWGNDLDESSLNNRPLSKFIQDIYKDIKGN